MSRFRCLIVLLVCLSGLACEARRQREVSPLPTAHREYLVAVVLDLSGSYQRLMLDEGKAWHFFNAVINRFFQDRAGSDDRIVIAQISATPKALLWEGTPMNLRRDFPNAAAFKDYLSKHSHPAGSRVHDSIADMVEYVNDYPGVKEGKTRTAVFVLSDMDNNIGGEESKKRLLSSLDTYAKRNGTVGMYWVEGRLLGEWKRHLQTCGFKSSVVESDIVSQPTLPSFDQ